MGYTGGQERWQRYALQGQGDPGMHLGVVELPGGLLGPRGGSGCADDCLLADSSVSRCKGGGADAGLLAGSSRHRRRRRGDSADAGLLAGSGMSKRRGGGRHLHEKPLAGGSRSRSGGAGGDHRAERRSSLSCRGSLGRRGRHADEGLLAGSGVAWGGGGDRRDEGRGGCKSAPQGRLYLQGRQSWVALDEGLEVMLDLIASWAMMMTTDYTPAARTPQRMLASHSMHVTAHMHGRVDDFHIMSAVPS